MSDLLNKCLVCDSNGLVILNIANDTANWIHKNKSFLHSFAQVAKFDVELKQKENQAETDQNNSSNYNISIDDLKPKKIIHLDLRTITTVSKKIYYN